MRTSVLVVMVGHPGTGKTTRAKELETELHAVRLAPDEWLRPLFGPEDDTSGRNTIEGRFVALTRRLLELGQSVILDCEPVHRAHPGRARSDLGAAPALGRRLMVELARRSLADQ